MSNATVNKTYYKIFLSYIKYVPNLLAIIQILCLILSYLKVTSFALTCIGGTSIIFILLLYGISYVFQFCGTHRLSIHYIATITGLTIFDWYVGIPLNVEALYTLYAIITGAFITSWIIIWYKNRKNSKIDHIKQLCDTYSDCNC
jgi:hypothetical protein